MSEYVVELADSVRTGYRYYASFLHQAMAEQVARRECQSGVIAPLWRVVGPDRRVTWAGSHQAMMEADGPPDFA